MTMTFISYHFLFAGIIIELLYLFLNSRFNNLLYKFLKKMPLFLKSINTKVYVVLFGLVALTALIITLLNGWHSVYLFLFETRFKATGDNYFEFVSEGLFLAVMLIAMFNTRLLPVVNEQIILMMIITFWYNIISRILLAEIVNMPVIALSAGITFFCLICILPEWKLSVVLKSLVYFWYLCMLSYVTLLFFPVELLLNTSNISPLEASILGSAAVYAVFHGFFLIRFGIILLSFWSRKHRYYAKPVVEEKFSDYQLPVSTAVFHFTILICALLINLMFNIVESYMLTLVIVVLIFQFASYQVRNRFNDRSEKQAGI